MKVKVVFQDGNPVVILPVGSFEDLSRRPSCVYLIQTLDAGIAV